MMLQVIILRRQREEGAWDQRINEWGGYPYNKRQSENYWEYVDGTWKWKKNPKPGETATNNEDARKLGFGEYAEWTYTSVLTNRR